MSKTEWTQTSEAINEMLTILKAEHPMTVRQLFYRLVSVGAITNTLGDYRRVSRLITKAPRDDRYNYLYSLDELEPWITRIKEVAKKTRESYVITNNHFRGQAVVNALEIKSTLSEKLVPAPAPLFQRYPNLADSALPELETSEPTLFT